MGYIYRLAKCPFCPAETMIKVEAEQLEAWRSGKNIQDAFPNLSAKDRELIQTGMCFECQDKTFKEPCDEEEEYHDDDVVCKWCHYIGQTVVKGDMEHCAKCDAILW